MYFRRTKEKTIFLFVVLLFNYFLVECAEIGVGTKIDVKKNGQNKAVVLKKFKQDLQKYMPSSEWIIVEFQKMNSDVFTQCWKEVVSLLCYDQSKYFPDYAKWDYQKKLSEVVRECLLYDSFLKSLFVDQQTGRLVYFKNAARQTFKNHGFSSVFEYWQAKREKTFYDFYAFCFDKCFELLVYSLQSAYLNMDNSVLYFFCVRRASKIYDSLQRMFSRLRNSQYESRYDSQLRRYKNVLAILTKEKKAYDVQ